MHGLRIWNIKTVEFKKTFDKQNCAIDFTLSSVHKFKSVIKNSRINHKNIDLKMKY